MVRLRGILVCGAASLLLCGMSMAASAQPDGSVVEMTRPRLEMGPRGGDHSGQLRRGEAGLMVGRRPGDQMANGAEYDPGEPLAASSTLPVGSTVRITNLDNGTVTMVQVQDVMPRGIDHLIDLSNASARLIGMTTAGARVEVAPLAVPQPDGTIRLGQGTGLAGQRAVPVNGAPRPRTGERG
ncbi:septal ring lytic transglycosylase RlpA family protein [Roseomonas elaeocarpi]|uniref:Septal ring lytic transglycosylase RlpA family protein n=1 Tax=Roseomonas elaeocarpi TaxID=907779 RepID=A0ABV6JNR3_9PROT